jgi:acyl-CoA synthetase (AMP-forming)/AMP-acid ligase II
VSIIDGFVLHAKHQPTAPAICAPGWNFNIVSYGRLHLFASNVAAHALAAGLRPGDVAAIFARDPIFHWAFVLGLTSIGVVSISLVETKLPTGLRIEAVLTDSHGRFGASKVVHVDKSWVMGDAKPLVQAGEQPSGATARIILTSGTSGEQKAVALSHDMIWRRIRTYSHAFGNRVAEASRVFLDVGIAANSGYLWGIYVLARGGTLFVRGSDPAETLQALSLYNVECMVASPAGMAEFLDYYERSPNFICPFAAMLSVGSKLATSLSDRVRTRMCSHVVHGYGATEGNPVAGGYVHQFNKIKNAIGFITPGMTVQAVDDADRPCPPGEDGHIRFQGERCVDAYYGNPAGSEKCFRNGWFYPGDIGAVTPEGVLIISGRSKNIIDIGGDKVSPEAIESVLLSFPGVVHAVAVGRPNALGIEEVWAAVESTAEINAATLRNHCAQRLAAALVPSRIVRVPTMPRNAGDKVDRRQVIRRLEAES